MYKFINLVFYSLLKFFITNTSTYIYCNCYFRFMIS